MSADYLVIVESPGKIKKLKHILGAQYDIMASMGHVRDLPAKSFGIDVATMEPEYVVVKADVVKRLQSAAKKGYRIVYLAADPDREGEAIAYHVAAILRQANPKIQLQRVQFDAITPTAVKAAFASPRQIDAHLVDAQETRRMLDRLVGFPASRLLWQFMTGKGLSAGRVQSVALRLVVERETRITSFVPETYWQIHATFQAIEGAFRAKLVSWMGQPVELKTKADAAQVVAQLDGVHYQITEVTPKRRQQKPPAPFTTSSLQQAASSHLKLSPENTMRLAQTLYELGLITYMRTDSPHVAPEGVAMAHEVVRAQYGENYIGNHTYGAKGKAQEAHEAIRPTDTQVTPNQAAMQLGTEQAQAADLYGLIYRRFLASQMAAAIFDTVQIKVAGGEATFQAKGSRLVFDGYLRVYALEDESEAEKDEDAEQNNLPVVKAGEAVMAQSLIPTEHHTQPPKRFSEALLVNALEKHGVGRPSTYASTIATLKGRGYLETKKRTLTPTERGQQVHAVLMDKLPTLFAVDFTAQMESTLDHIAAGEQGGRGYLQDFWRDVAPLFGTEVVAATLNQKSDKKKAPAVVDEALGVCPECGKPLAVRNGKHGAFVGCTGYPKCRYTRNMTETR